MNLSGALALFRVRWPGRGGGSFSMLGVLAVALAGVLALPVLVVLSNVFVAGEGAWPHLAATVLPTYIRNSLLLMLGVAVGVMVGGVTTAWLTVMCRFPGRALFEWALLLPLAVPA
jgi:iron(III) transport system permease protein